MTTPKAAKVNLTAKSDHILERIQDLADAEDQFDSYFNGNPRPSWLKWVRGERLAIAYVNAAYTRETGISVAAYKGREDRTLWGDAQDFGEADRTVVQKRRPVRITELAPNPLTGRDQYWIGWKWPYIVRGSVVGVWGSAVPVDREFYDKHKDTISEFLNI